MRNLRWVFLLAPFYSVASYAQVEWGGSISIENEHSDNITLVENNEASDNVTNVGASLDVESTGARHTANASYEYRKEYYSKDTFDENSILEGTLSLVGMLKPRRFHWFLNHTQENSITNSRDIDTPDNREQRSIISTGPQAFFYPSKRGTLQATARYSEVDLEENSQNESKRAAGAILWSHILTKLTSLQVSANSEDVKFVNINGADYKRHSLSIGLVGNRALFDYSFFVGGNEINPENGDNLSGKFVEAEISKTYRASTYSLSVSRELTDTVYGGGDLDLTAGGETLAEANVGELGIIEQTEIVFSGTQSLLPSRLDVYFDIAYEKDDSKDELTIDETRYRVDLGARYTFNRSLDGFLNLESTTEEFHSDPKQKDDNLRAEIGVVYRFSPRANLTCSVAHETNESNVQGADYEELSGVVSFAYLFGSNY